MRLRDKLSIFRRYWKDEGLVGTGVLALYKLFPKPFVLLARQLTKGGAGPTFIATDYRAAIKDVQDYLPWTSYGGSAAPADKTDDRPCLIWFVPDWTNVWGGGHYTLFRFANHFAHRGTRNIIFIYNNQRHNEPDHLQQELDAALSDCKIEVIVDPAKLPSAAAAIATTWQSAFQVRAFPFAGTNIYFMQDYESYFYAFGTASMQANVTYEFGFHGVTGGGWLKQCYESHGGKAINYRFAADRTIFYPASAGRVRNEVKRLFFYGRPSTERRCFDLGMASLEKIHAAFPAVEIIIAGLDLKTPPPFPATLLGNMSLSKTGELYRTCDVGMAFSATNLSYLPVELMASGVPTISNNGAHIEWHCKHLENSYLADPTPEAVLKAFAALHDDAALRQRLADGGLKTMESLSWEEEMEKIFTHVMKVAGG